MKLYISIPIIVVCLILSAFFSAMETAFSTVNVSTLRKEAKSGNKRAQLSYRIITNYDKSVSTVLFGNNLVNIFISTLMVSITALFNLDGIYERILSIAFSVLILLFFGEIIPKQLGKIYNHSFVLRGCRIFNVFYYLFWVITFPISWIGGVFSKIFVRKKNIMAEVEVDEELQEMVDLIEDEGVIERDKAEMVRSAIEFNTTEAYEIMKPRVDVKMFDINDDYRDFIKDKSYFVYSRIPIYDGDKDNVIGILPIKLLERKILANQEINISKLMYKPLFVPHSMKISDVMLEFRKEKHHMAIVIDEFGGVEGALTMEDILEELVGEIYDETDVITSFYSKIRGGYVVDGLMNIDDFFDLVETENDDEKISYTTVGGWATDKLEKFPKVGDKFKYKNLVISILEMDKYSVERVKVIIKKPKLE